MAFVRGHALSMKAIHGGKAQHDTIDSHKMAALLRGGMLPPADVYPAEMRATRDLLRRRTHLLRQRSELLGHVQNTNSQYNLPEIDKKIASTTNRDGVAERFDDPAGHKNIDVDLGLITSDDGLLTDRGLSIVKTAKPHDAHTFSRLHAIPGGGKILALVLLYDIHDVHRFPSVQDVVSYCRLVTCAREAAGKRLGTSGKTIGNAPLKWPFSEAATLCLRNHPQGQKLLSRLEKTHHQGKALSLLAHTLGRAVYSMLKRKTACDMDLFLRSYGSRAGEPGA
jgi:transposase